MACPYCGNDAAEATVNGGFPPAEPCEHLFCAFAFWVEWHEPDGRPDPDSDAWFSPVLRDLDPEGLVSGDDGLIEVTMQSWDEERLDGIEVRCGEYGTETIPGAPDHVRVHALYTPKPRALA